MVESAATAGERRILADAPSGNLVDLTDLSEEERVVSPEVIRRLCVGPEAKEVDPRGIRIKGAHIVEPLDLSFCTIPHPLRVEATTFDAMPDVSGTRLPALGFEGCSLPGLRADGIRTDDLRLGSSEVSGGVRLLDARIDGQLVCSGATLTNEGGEAFSAEAAEITGHVLFKDGFSATGAVWLLGAKIGGQLDCSGATLSNEGGTALSLDAAAITGPVFLRNGFSATGEVWLLNARIGGPLDCSGATLTNEGGDALSLDGAEITGGVFLLGGFSATGAVRLLGARIGGDLYCSGATLSNEDGIALVADGAEISGSVFLANGFSATGGVRLLNARIGGQFNCSGATLTNEGGEAFSAEAAEITGGVFLLGGFSATGAVRLLGAKIGGQLNCSGATLSNEDGVALMADSAEITGPVFLRNGFSATGEVRLLNARIGGQLDCSGATLANADGDALSADEAEISGGVFLIDGFSAAGAVRFPRARIGGHLACRGATLMNRGGVALAARDVTIGSALVFSDVLVTGGVDLFRASATTLDDDLGRADDPLGSWRGVQPLVLDSFAYARFSHEAVWGSKHRCRWLQQTSTFQQSAWQQLIEIYRAQGRDDEATRAAIAMHNDRVKRAGLPRYRRWGRQVLRVVVGHGYRPLLAGAWAAGIVAAFALVVWQWSGMFVPEAEGLTGSPQPVAYATDTFLPIVDLGQAGDWMPTGWVRWVDWSVILSGWALTTLFVAGFTRIVRS